MPVFVPDSKETADNLGLVGALAAVALGKASEAIAKHFLSLSLSKLAVTVAVADQRMSKELCAVAVASAAD